MKVVLDASAMLAVLFEEPGSESVVPIVRQAVMSAVNVAEVVGKLVDRGWGDEEARRALGRFRLSVVPFDRDDAVRAGVLRRNRRGLSLGDRACLALAMAEGARVLTADRAWAGLDLGVEVEVIR